MARTFDVSTEAPAGVDAVSKAINGGSVGLQARRDALKLCAKVWTPSAVINPKALVPRPTAALTPAHA